MNYGIDCVHGFDVGEICPYCPGMAESHEREAVESAQKIRHMRQLNGWLGMICDALLGTDCLEKGRAPTVDEARKAREGPGPHHVRPGVPRRDTGLTCWRG